MEANAVVEHWDAAVDHVRDVVMPRVFDDSVQCGDGRCLRHRAESWGVLDDAGALDRAPAAGWNVCHRADTQYGHFDRVCLFDGDIFDEGLPYRTDEVGEPLDEDVAVEGLPYRTDEVRTTAGDPQATRRSISITVVARCARSRSCCE